MRFINVSDLTAKVSDVDYDLVSKYTWWANPQSNGNIYAYTQERVNGKKRTLYMHRLITNCPDRLVVDHWDKDTLNNQRRNLRVTTSKNNIANRELLPGVSGFKGVIRRYLRTERRYCYEVQIRAGERKYLGRHMDPVLAAKVYDAAAVEAWGEFAVLNFPEDWNFPDPDTCAGIIDTF